jgi:tripartite-type tricarboxylate transporter receptor subunit TctC
MDRRASPALLAAVVLVAGLTAANSQASDPPSDYPARPVRVIVPFAPGGVVDVMGRLLAQKLSDATGKNFYIDNIGGAGGNIGTRTAAAAPKDGTTIAITSSSFVVNPGLHAKVPYDPIKDFSPITIAAVSPNVVVVHPRETATNLKQLVESIRNAPSKYSFASAGVGTTPHLSGELFRLSAGLDLVHVPFAGAGPALQSTVGGHTLIAFSALPPAVPLVKNGSLRALASTSVKRLNALPDVPTMAEQGFSGQEAETLLFVLAPADTPADVVNWLNGEIRRIVERPEVQRQFDTLGFTALATTPGDSAERIRVEIAKWSKVIKDANLRQAGD